MQRSFYGTLPQHPKVILVWVFTNCVLCTQRELREMTPLARFFLGCLSNTWFSLTVDWGLLEGQLRSNQLEWIHSII